MDYLYGTPFAIEQDEKMYHFNSDSELLGRFLRPSQEDHVLDVGVNNGVLLLYAAMYYPFSLTGIDLFEEVIDLAKKNLSRYQIQAELAVSPLQDFHGGPFTLVLCNPPFFTVTREDLKSRNPYRRAARFTDTLTMKELLFHSRRLLSCKGRLDVIYPFSMLEDVLSEAKKNELFLSRIQPVFKSRRKEAERILMEFSKERQDTFIRMPPAYLDSLHEAEKVM